MNKTKLKIGPLSIRPVMAAEGGSLLGLTTTDSTSSPSQTNSSNTVLGSGPLSTGNSFSFPTSNNYSSPFLPTNVNSLGYQYLGDTAGFRGLSTEEVLEPEPEVVVDPITPPPTPQPIEPDPKTRYTDPSKWTYIRPNPDAGDQVYTGPIITNEKIPGVNGDWLASEGPDEFIWYFPDHGSRRPGLQVAEHFPGYNPQ